MIAISQLVGVVLQTEDYDALGAFRYGMRKFLRFSRDLLAEERLTPEQYEALLAVKTQGGTRGLNIRDLSERLQVKHHTAVSLVNKLVARKLVTKKRAAQDRREMHLTLTPAGDSTLAQLAAIHRREIRKRGPELIDVLERLIK